MLKSLHIENLTVFPKADFTFGKNLNIIIGENGSGKSHILKAAYCAIAVSAKGAKDSASEVPTKTFLATAIADKLRNVFKPDELGRLARRRQGHTACHIKYVFNPSKLDLEFSFKTPSKKEVVVSKVPTDWAERRPVFLPTRELLTISPGFVSLYETTHLPFEETWRDTCILLGAPLAKGPREHRIKELLVPIEAAMGGSVELDKSGRFYLKVATGNMEMHLVAEGLRKLATIARLIATGSLLNKGYLFWDEPESNLNPRIIRTVARTILQIAASGIQVFIATHSLFLLRELHILQQQEFRTLDTRCFGLHIGEDGAVSVWQGKTMDEVGSIAALDEDLQQSERYIDTEMGLSVEGTRESSMNA
ncbi:MAG: ATP-binding protein [Betaproteobacteria bacterium]|nr:ATP-binding protein [Betaproteobacteria bacterium]